jgi:NADH-quinone oxidoreductase subunit G
LKRRRLDRPWVRENGKLRAATWTEAFDAIATKLKPLSGDRIGAIAGDLCDAESVLALKDLLASLGSTNVDCRQDGAKLDASRRDFYCFNTSIAGIEEADAMLIVGSNPRKEAPVLNARIRKTWLAHGCPIGLIGNETDLTYAVTHLGASPAVLTDLHSGTHDFAKVLAGAKKPMIIVGQGALARPDGSAILAAAWRLAAQVGALSQDWHGFNVLHTAAGRVGALDLGFVPGPNGKTAEAMMGGGVDLLWLLGADAFDPARIAAGTFVVYQGHHGDAGAQRADVILPGAAYTEKAGTYVNTEGRAQRGFRAVYPPGDAREDWTILRAFSAVIGKTLPYDTIEAVRARLEQVNPVFGRVGFLPRFGCSDHTGPVGDPAVLSDAPLMSTVVSYYVTDPISRASPTMAACVEAQAVPVMAAE